MAWSLRVARLTIDEFLALTVAVIAARVVILGLHEEVGHPFKAGGVFITASLFQLNVPSPVGGGGGGEEEEHGYILWGG